MFTSRFLAPRNPSDSCTDAITKPRQNKMLQRHAVRHRRSSFPATQLVGADLMKPLDGDIFPVAPAITSIDVVEVEPELPPRPEIIQPADIGPTVDVASAEAISVESVVPAPGMVPTIADSPAIGSALTPVPVEEITTTLPATHAATAEPKVQVAPEIITATPAIVAVKPADTVTADEPPATPKKAKNRGKKAENEGLASGTGRPKKPRRRSATRKLASSVEDQNGLRGNKLPGTSGAHSPP